MDYALSPRNSTEALRTIAVEGLVVAPSCLGFGCASLGSRIGARAGLRALDAAFDAGITWYDVAPAYGAGQAEPLLARFLRGRRDKLVVTTKAGLAPPRPSSFRGMARAVVRPALGVAGGLRKTLRRTGVSRNRALPIDGALVRRSIEASLRQLSTDYVDVYALHDPDPASIQRADVMRALEDVLQHGKAVRIAVAGNGEACAVAARLGRPYSVVQTSTDELATVPDGPRPPLRIAHSVFGVGGRRERLMGTLAARPELVRRLADDGYDGDIADVSSDLLIDAAFAANAGGVVLASMFEPRHLARNVARATTIRPEALALLAEILA